MDRLDGMRIFATVARHRSFAAAARQTGLSPSAVTRAVAQVEDRLGVMLLRRTTRSVSLTEQGERYLESCRQILDDLDTAEAAARGSNAEPRGRLNVAAPLVFGRLHVLPIVTRLLSAHPNLVVRLSLSDRNVDLVDDGIDVAVRIGALADSSLVAVKLGEVGRVAAASPAYLRRRGTPAAPADLATHDTIAFDPLEASGEWRFAGVPPVRIEPRLTVNSADAAILAAESGLGVVRTLSYQLDASIQRGRLKPVLAGFAPPPAPVSVVYPPRRIPSPAVTAFVAAARAYFRTHAVGHPGAQSRD